MSLSADDDFLVAIVQQALVAYATHQLGVCRTALQNWQAEAALVVGTGDSRVQQSLPFIPPRSSAGKATWSVYGRSPTGQRPCWR